MSDGKSHELDLPLSWCVSEQACLSIVVTATLLEDVNHPSETSSIPDRTINTIEEGEDETEELVPVIQTPMKAKATPATVTPSKQLPSNPSATSKLFPPVVMPIPINTSSSASDSSRLQELQNTVDNLEAAILASEEIVAHERNRAKEALQRAGNAERQLQKLTQQLEKDQNRNQSSEDERSTLLKENLRLKEQFDILTAQQSKQDLETGKWQTLLGRTTDEMEAVTNQRDELQKALDAANKENQNLLQELIATKMSVGTLSTELDETKKTLRRLQQGESNKQPINPNGNSNGKPNNPTKPSTQQQPQQKLQSPFPTSNVKSPFQTNGSGASQMMRGFGDPSAVKNPFSSSNNNNQKR